MYNIYSTPQNDQCSVHTVLEYQYQSVKPKFIQRHKAHVN